MKSIQPPHQLASIGIAALLFSTHSTATAASFALDEHGTSGLGTAYAGGVAGAEDASTVWWNPAGMVLLKSRQLAISSAVIFTNFDVVDQGSTLNPLLGGGPIPGRDGNTDQTGLVPSLYYVTPLNDRITLGLGVDAPFGLATKYRAGWFGRYQALESDVFSLNANPNLAFKVTDKVALAVGVNAIYFRVKLTSAIDQSAVCLGLEGGGVFPMGTCASAGLMTPGNRATDGRAKVEVDDWGFGFNLGTMITPTDNVRFGLTYRSKIDINSDGDGDFNDMSPLFTNPLVNLFTDTNAAVNINLPASAAAGIFYQLNPRWAIMADITWTDWSTLPEVRVQFDNPNQPDAVESLNYNDSFAYRIGLHYQYNDHWKFRLGVAFDESAMPNKKFATPRVPTGDRTWIGIGANYTLSPRWTVDVGYAHLFYDTIKFDRTLETEIPPANATLRAKTDDESTDIFGVQFTWRF